MRNQRINEGRQEAKLKGINFGRNRVIDREKVLSLHRQKIGATQIIHQLKIARSTVYKIVDESKG
ncbi:Helix-turn-helix domain of resolvase [Xenorhabdus japonica]|uniref:Helix-turn-helix domain of resolvase n=1 Tax=Xenorhabdus japonica TaxID=53341 RepID=A0A1I5DKJ9_9GAMM|nr:Helix-turn-helix domain of resolvase [Xenorhabdus japonica]